LHWVTGFVSDLSSGITLSTSAWCHVAFIGDYHVIGTPFWRTYVNGVAGATVNTTTASSTGGLWIGNDSGLVSGFGGRIADVAVWNDWLTPAEIAALAQGVRPGNIRSASLQRWYSLDGINSPEPDLSGFGNNGTLTGTTNAAGPPLMLFTPRREEVFAVAADAAQIYVFDQVAAHIGRDIKYAGY